MTMQFPGRHPCECLAQKHSLINNCLECGRIVCVQVRPAVICEVIHKQTSTVGAIVVCEIIRKQTSTVRPTVL